jgi:hypothetical protein
VGALDASLEILDGFHGDLKTTREVLFSGGRYMLASLWLHVV